MNKNFTGDLNLLLLLHEVIQIINLRSKIPQKNVLSNTTLHYN